MRPFFTNPPTTAEPPAVPNSEPALGLLVDECIESFLTGLSLPDIGIVRLVYEVRRTWRLETWAMRLHLHA